MSIEKDGNGNVVMTGESIQLYRLLVLAKALQLETIGMRSRGTSAATKVRVLLEANGIKPARKKTVLLTQMKAFCESLRGKTVSFELVRD